MNALDFDMSKEINFDFEQGITSFRDSRLLILDANAIGLLRQNMIEELGIERARAFFFKLGYQNAYSDFMQTKINYQFENEFELLKVGPVIHTWEGKVKSAPVAFEFDRAKGEFRYQGLWKNSYEAEQHLSYNEVSTEPTCWLSMGYASGWATGFFGKRVICIERECMGMGHDACRTLIQLPELWGEEGEPYRQALKDLPY
jgi:hypothetical protein